MAEATIRTDAIQPGETLALVHWEKESIAMYGGRAVRVLQAHPTNVAYYLVRFVSTNQLRYVHGGKLYEVSEP